MAAILRQLTGNAQRHGAQRPLLPPAEVAAAHLDRRLYSYRRIAGDGYWLGAQTADWKYHEHITSERVRMYFYGIGPDPVETVRWLQPAVPGLEHASEKWLENDTVFNILQDPQRHVFPAVMEIASSNYDRPCFIT